ncbi:hypothetical protein D3C71_2176490 [compost metagenome]
MPEVVSQAIFGGAPLLDFRGHAFELLVGHPDQHPDFIVVMVHRAFQRWLLGDARVTLAQLADDPYQRLGQHHIK